MTITKKGSALCLRRRVPIRFGAVERRAVVWIALNTDSMGEAEAKAAQVWETQLQGWDAELAGRSEVASERFEAAHQLARIRGFRWLPVEKVATIPVREVLDRVEASLSPDGGIDPVRGAAFLGVAKTPVYRISDVLDDYWKLAEDKAQGKSQDQQRRMRNPRRFVQFWSPGKMKQLVQRNGGVISGHCVFKPAEMCTHPTFRVRGCPWNANGGLRSD